MHREVEIISLGNIYGAEVLRFAYKKSGWFSQEQLINHLISNRELTQEFNALKNSYKNYNFKNYDEKVSKVVNWLYKKGWLDFSFEPQKGAQKRFNRKSVQISASGRQFWDYLDEVYGTRGLLTAQLNLSWAYRKQTLSFLGIDICIAIVLFAAFLVLLLVLNDLSSYL